MPEISVAGRRVRYQEAGSGPALLLLHAFPLSSALFRPQLDAARVGDLPARVIAPDLRGFGGSGPAGADAVTMEDHAADALRLLDALGVDRAFVGGSSMGGYVAMALLRAAPERVLGLALLGTMAAADDDAGRARREDTARAVLADGVPFLVTSMMPRLVAPGSPATAEVEALIRSSATTTGAAGSLRGMGLRAASFDVLAAFQGPAVIVSGAVDPITGPDKASAMAAVLPRAEVTIVPDVGHLVSVEAPEVVNQALAGLVRSVNTGSAPGAAPGWDAPSR